METVDSAATRSAPCVRTLVIGAASITLAVLLLRLWLELAKAPAWLAGRKAGGGFALIGIDWLPLVFGPVFLHRLRTGAESTWALLKRLVKVLVVYGWSAHVPVVIVTMLALYFGWDTHFNQFGDNGNSLAVWKKVVATLVFQLVLWSMIWTPLAGGLTGLVYHWITRKGHGTSEALRATQGAS